jgi:hypothetical protein
VTKIEQICIAIEDAKIMKRFQAMKDRNGHLPKERIIAP